MMGTRETRRKASSQGGKRVASGRGDRCAQKMRKPLTVAGEGKWTEFAWKKSPRKTDRLFCNGEGGDKES